jgi:hypothetical protein
VKNPSSFFAFIGPFEGLYLDDGSVFSWLGLDVKGRPCAEMSHVIWRRVWSKDGGTGQAAQADELAHEWARVKAMVAHSASGAASPVFRDSAHLYLDLASLYSYLTRVKLANFEAALRKSIPNWDDLPEGIQTARMRTEWADGDDAWPKLDAAIVAGDWAQARQECLPALLQFDLRGMTVRWRNPARPGQTEAYLRSYQAVADLYAAHAQSV